MEARARSRDLGVWGPGTPRGTEAARTAIECVHLGEQRNALDAGKGEGMGPGPLLGPIPLRGTKGRKRVRGYSFLPGAIQSLRTGKLTTTAARVFTTEAMVPESVSLMPRVCWQKAMT